MCLSLKMFFPKKELCFQFLGKMFRFSNNKHDNSLNMGKHKFLFIYCRLFKLVEQENLKVYMSGTRTQIVR